MTTTGAEAAIELRVNDIAQLFHTLDPFPFRERDAKVQHSTRSPVLSAAVTVSNIAFIVIVPAMLVIGTLLNEAVRSAALIGPLIDGEGRTRAIDSHPWLATVWRWVNEQFDVPDLIKALTSVLAG